MGNELGGRLDLVYRKINERAPGARVAVTGYPKLFNGTDCNLLTFFTPSEMARFNDATVKLNVLIKNRAQAAGFRFVEAVPAFLGHAWCDRQPWINGLTISPNSFQVARAAARAGVTKAELRRLRAAQRAKIPNAQLDRLDRQITARAAKRLQER